MKKYNGDWDEVQEFGDYSSIIPGGYICKIKKVQSEEKPYGTLLRIDFDVVEGEFANYYQKKFDSNTKADKKWPGMTYQTARDEDMRFFKAFIKSIEDSTLGYKWDWDESKLAGKFFGGVFQDEEYLNSAGEVRTFCKLQRITTVNAIREGKFKLLDVKKLKREESPIIRLANESFDDLPF
jgi:hypothetical protein